MVDENVKPVVSCFKAKNDIQGRLILPAISFRRSVFLASHDRGFGRKVRLLNLPSFCARESDNKLYESTLSVAAWEGG